MQAVGAVVRHIGLNSVLRAIPLNIDPNVPVTLINFKRSWLLPVLRINIYRAPLSIFNHLFLPLSIKLYQKIESVDEGTAKILATVQVC